jgi:hypothetical protein
MFVWLVWYLWQKKRHLFLPIIAIVVVALSIFVALIFNYSNSLSGIPVLSWLGELANEFKSRDLTSWSLFSGIFGSRFEIWEAAIRMWWEFPLMGIGQGNFYHLSEIASFSKSHFLILNHGENTHNYFLQTLTETGIVGVIAFVIALLVPIFSGGNKKILIPGLIALISLFFGNFFSHSFLVRENLLLAGVLVGLLYVLVSAREQSIKVGEKVGVRSIQGALRKVMLSCLGALIFFVALEIFFSFGKFPFVHGYSCNVRTPLDADGWVRGNYAIEVPQGATGASLYLSLPPNSRHRDGPVLKVYLARRDSAGNLHQLASFLIEQLTHQKQDFDVYIPLTIAQPLSPIDKIELMVSTSSCYSPRNIGDSLDSRVLGINIRSIHFLN